MSDETPFSVLAVQHQNAELREELDRLAQANRELISMVEGHRAMVERLETWASQLDDRWAQAEFRGGQPFANELRRRISGSGFVAWPRLIPPRYNGSGEPCDMWTGPCCCGATHKEGV